jgi:hypothetical protein
LPSAQNSSTTIENKLVKLTINKGIYCWSYFKNSKGLKGSGELVKLIKDQCFIKCSVNYKWQSYFKH